MNASDKTTFTIIIIRVWKFYGKVTDCENLESWFDLLKYQTLEEIMRAFEHHLHDPQAGLYLPKQANIVQYLATLQQEQST